MRRLTIFVAIVAALYSAYWFVGSRTLKTLADTQIAALRDDGWSVDYDALVVRGFPSRFDTTLTDIDIASPDGTMGYVAPMLQALALSYQPNAVILAFPENQEVTFRNNVLTAQSSGMRASVKAKANTALSLNNVTVEAAEMAISSAVGDALTFTDFLAALRLSGPLPNTYDLYANLANISVPTALRAQLSPTTGLPETISVATIDAAVTLDRPLDRHTLPEWQTDPGRLRHLQVKSMVVSWGDFVIRGEGALAINPAGVPDGTITVSVNDWQRVLDIAQTAGFIPSQYQFMASSIGQTLSGGADDLDLPITFMNGNLSIGPIPLGPAPSIY